MPRKGEKASAVAEIKTEDFPKVCMDTLLATLQDKENVLWQWVSVTQSVETALNKHLAKYPPVRTVIQRYVYVYWSCYLAGLATPSLTSSVFKFGTTFYATILPVIFELARCRAILIFTGVWTPYFYQ